MKSTYIDQKVDYSETAALPKINRGQTDIIAEFEKRVQAELTKARIFTEAKYKELDVKLDQILANQFEILSRLSGKPPIPDPKPIQLRSAEPVKADILSIFGIKQDPIDEAVDVPRETKIPESESIEAYNLSQALAPGPASEPDLIEEFYTEHDQERKVLVADDDDVLAHMLVGDPVSKEESLESLQLFDLLKNALGGEPPGALPGALPPKPPGDETLVPEPEMKATDPPVAVEPEIKEAIPVVPVVPVVPVSIPEIWKLGPKPEVIVLVEHEKELEVKSASPSAAEETEIWKLGPKPEVIVLISEPPKKELEKEPKHELTPELRSELTKKLPTKTVRRLSRR